jgi:hypothetical protein
MVADYQFQGGGPMQRSITQFKETISRDFRHLAFFHESITPRPLSIPLGPFQFLKKFAEIFAAEGYSTGVNNAGD